MFVNHIYFSRKGLPSSNPVWGAKPEKVKVWLKKYLREISKFANKMAEVHGNRTHLGGY